MSKFFNVVSDTKYFIELEGIDSIEDAGEDFVTSEELQEMTGMSYFGTGVFLKEQKIKEELAGWKQKIIDRGSKTIVIDDQELIGILQQQDRSVSEFVEGLRRVGNRLFLHDKKEKVVATKSNHDKLIGLATRAIGEKFGFIVEVKFYQKKRSSATSMIKKLIEWEDIPFGQFDYSEKEQELMKQTWDNPTMFDE